GVGEHRAVKRLLLFGSAAVIIEANGRDGGCEIGILPRKYIRVRIQAVRSGRTYRTESGESGFREPLARTERNRSCSSRSKAVPIRIDEVGYALAACALPAISALRAIVSAAIDGIRRELGRALARIADLTGIGGV